MAAAGSDLLLWRFHATVDAGETLNTSESELVPGRRRTFAIGTAAGRRSGMISLTVGTESCNS